MYSGKPVAIADKVIAVLTIALGIYAIALTTSILVLFAVAIALGLYAVFLASQAAVQFSETESPEYESIDTVL
jgi:uncharacterized membrane protein YiaA